MINEFRKGPVRRVGLTMRITSATGYEESRDALAQDWSIFLGKIMPDTDWLGIPNVGKKAVHYAESWELDALILTGGDAYGDTPLRDLTEFSLLKYFTNKKMPVLGVCRGMQMIHIYFGGVLTSCNPEEHIGTRHKIYLTRELIGITQGARCPIVNSFHGQAINNDNLPTGLDSLAITKDNYVEAFKSKKSPLLGIMWHPEREIPINPLDHYLLRKHFGYLTNIQASSF